MATLLFKLNNVPEDEAIEVRQLLEEGGFPIYETQAGFWGLGVSAIWLSDKSRVAEAKAAIRAYQEERARTQQALHAEQRARGESPTIGQKFLAHPIRFLAALLAILFVLGLTLIPFYGLMSQATA
ncbi:DUF6164 family protein [Marinimicrobium alkaliphilum]|uniref:DUF6164 family protein n=1 Tax=Marinimicrobium alkaliphilum TaxID=2202654 RepID=UPI000DB9A49D|nr:DUF6164 family protein [Marinimicrobium alkaliphilum]